VLPDGYVTVVDFWSESCGACVIVGGMLAVQTAKDTGVVIRKVDVGDGDTPVAKQFDVGALPHYKLYDRHKKLRYSLVGNECLKAPELAKQLAAE
jgi:thiol-disulfide isomerase/thioredoxin